jgi:hypothetical protein
MYKHTYLRDVGAHAYSDVMPEFESSSVLKSKSRSGCWPNNIRSLSSIGTSNVGEATKLCDRTSLRALELGVERLLLERLFLPGDLPREVWVKDMLRLRDGGDVGAEVDEEAERSDLAFSDCFCLAR